MVDVYDRHRALCKALIDIRVELYGRRHSRYHGRRYGRRRTPCRALVELYAKSWRGSLQGFEGAL